MFLFSAWGQHLGEYLTIPVVNLAIAGRSARSYTEEGHFNTLINTVDSGDYAIIEFGHNDGYPGVTDNGRQSASGSDYSATSTIEPRGDIPIVSSQTPNNQWTGDKIKGPPRFVEYARLAGSNADVTYVNHLGYTASKYESRGIHGFDVFPIGPYTHIARRCHGRCPGLRAWP